MILRPKDINLDVVRQHSHAEYLICKSFLDIKAEEANNWRVYYSYCFKNSNVLENNYKNRRFSEIDFLILAPNLGVFVFEIKGGKITINDGEFYSNNIKIEDPIKQAHDNFFSISNELKTIKTTNKKEKRFNEFAGGFIVGFPDISTVPDIGAKSTNGIYVNGMDLYEFIVNYAKYGGYSATHGIIPTEDDIKIIEELLNGKNFTYSLDKKHYIELANLTIDQLTEQQQTVFDGLLDNERCLINGAAGTGKTILCGFLFKKITEVSNAIYFSYNRAISNYLNRELENDDSKCYPIDDYICYLYNQYSDDEIDFLEDDNRKDVIEKVTRIVKEKEIKYSCLIIDEAQDICADEQLINFLDSILIGGLKDGKCYIFYDDNQNINIKSITQKLYNNELFGKNGARYTKFSLNINCRNTRLINDAMSNILKKDINKLSNGIELLNNDNVIVEQSNNDKETFSIVKDIVKRLEKKEGVKKNQITILFDTKLSNNIVYDKLCEYFEHKITELPNKDTISISTVRKFKGLENDIVIYVNSYSKEKRMHYVAISRAKVLAYVVTLNK